MCRGVLLHKALWRRTRSWCRRGWRCPTASLCAGRAPGGSPAHGCWRRALLPTLIFGGQHGRRGRDLCTRCLGASPILTLPRAGTSSHTGNCDTSILHVGLIFFFGWPRPGGDPLGAVGRCAGTWQPLCPLPAVGSGQPSASAALWHRSLCPLPGGAGGSGVRGGHGALCLPSGRPLQCQVQLGRGLYQGLR